MKRAYLATSYTWKPKNKWIAKLFVRSQQSFLNRLVMLVRYYRVTKATAKLMVKTGWNIFSPITHSHPIPRWIPERLDTHTFWLNLDFDWIDTCDEVWVYMQPGWDESYGVERELKYAQRKEKTIRFVNMNYEFVVTDEDYGNILGGEPRFYVLPKAVR